MNYATATPVTASPAVYTPGAGGGFQQAGFLDYSASSFGQGVRQLGSALSNDAAGILDWGAGMLGFGNPANQAAAQAAIAADPSIIDPTSPNYRGAFIGPGGAAPGIGSEPGLLTSDLFSGAGIGPWLLLGGAAFLLVALAPSINNLTAPRRG